MPQGDVWRWPVTLGSSVAVDFKPLEISFGEGYAQRIAQPAAAHQRKFRVEARERPINDVADMEAFLAYHAGATSFDFIERDTGKAVRVICKTYTKTYTGQVHASLSAEFQVVREYP